MNLLMRIIPSHIKICYGLFCILSRAIGGANFDFVEFALVDGAALNYHTRVHIDYKDTAGVGRRGIVRGDGEPLHVDDGVSNLAVLSLILVDCVDLLTRTKRAQDRVL